MSSPPKPSSRDPGLHSLGDSQETTPLLSRREADEPVSHSTFPNSTASPAATSLQSIQDNLDGNKKGGRRWATIISLSVLSLLTLAILGLGFAAPAIVEEYAKEAVVVTPTGLSIHSFTELGVRARIQADLTLDASRVQTASVRNVGRAGTWIARKVESGNSEVKVYLPEYGDVLLGTALAPPIKVDIRNGHENHLDFLMDLEPGDVDGLRRIANDWLDGRVTSLIARAVAKVPVKSGIFGLGTRNLSQSLLFEGSQIPGFPEFDIEKLEFSEYGPPGRSEGMVATASVTILNEYPVRFDVPSLRFDILVPNCLPNEDYILLGNAKTEIIHIVPKDRVNVNVTGMVRQLPQSLTTACPGSTTSPLDSLLGDYLRGRKTTIFVRGGSEQDAPTPDWIANLIRDTTGPLPLPGHPFDNLIHNFSLTNVHFSLPEPFAEPNTPEAQPKISAVVKALVGLPKEMNINLDVDQVRADADIFYEGKKLGELDLHTWQKAQTSRIDHKNAAPELLIESAVDKALLNITNDDLFTEVVQKLIFGGKGVVLGVEAQVDVNTVTTLGEFVVRKIPAQGKVFVKPISGRGFSTFRPQIGDLQIVDTTTSSITLQAKVNFTNPTEYSARIPFVNIHILHNDTILGYAEVKNIDVAPGNNTNLLVEAVWDPRGISGKNGSELGRNFLSQYLSGYNTTLALKAHEATVPSQPSLGRALSSLEIVINTPKLSQPQDPDDDGPDNGADGDDSAPHFIKDATMYLISSTATFILLSPLAHTTIYITSIAATAFYNHTEPVGTIDHSYQFAVPPGASTTPRLPVDWTLGGAGYDAVRAALGGSLKLDASADVGVRIDKWAEKLWFVGGGIGASIRL